MPNSHPPAAADYKFHDQVMRVLPIAELAGRFGRDRTGARLLATKAMRRTRLAFSDGHWRLHLDCRSKISPAGSLVMAGPELAALALNILFAVLLEENPNLFAAGAQADIAAINGQSL